MSAIRRRRIASIPRASDAAVNRVDSGGTCRKAVWRGQPFLMLKFSNHQ